MTTFPGAPRLLKGALITLDASNRVEHVIIFQINPNTVTRTLEAQVMEGEGGTEALRFTGAPVESIKLDVEIDATDQLEKGEENAASMGIYPQLAALETLLYPASDQVTTNSQLMSLGTLEIIPPTVPLTLFVWGARRIVPVRVTEFSVTEDAHSPDLNPLRAKVSLGLRVMSTSDFSSDSPGWNLFLAHQIVKETMAAQGRSSNLDAVTGGNFQLW